MGLQTTVGYVRYHVGGHQDYLKVCNAPEHPNCLTYGTIGTVCYSFGFEIMQRGLTSIVVEKNAD